jgi:hypothetical protein
LLNCTAERAAAGIVDANTLCTAIGVPFFILSSVASLCDEAASNMALALDDALAVHMSSSTVFSPADLGALLKGCFMSTLQSARRVGVPSRVRNCAMCACAG